jgi:hypothetical protein
MNVANTKSHKYVITEKKVYTKLMLKQQIYHSINKYFSVHSQNETYKQMHHTY